jgi:hypothetical protein
MLGKLKGLTLSSAAAGVFLFAGCIASGNPQDDATAAARASGTPGAAAEAAPDSGAGGGTTKVTLCHIPPGNPANMHTITVGEPAVQAHLGHGDKLGACAGGDGGSGGGNDGGTSNDPSTGPNVN